MPCVNRSIDPNMREETPPLAKPHQLPEIGRQHNQPLSHPVYIDSSVTEVSCGTVGSIPLDETQTCLSNDLLTKNPAHYSDTQDGICLDQNCSSEENNCAKQSPEKAAKQRNVKSSTQTHDETLLNVIESVDLDQAVQLLKVNNHFSQDGLDRALISACRHGFKFLVQTLVRLGANVQVKDPLGNTPLLICAESGFVDIVCFLLKMKADMNASNSSGDTALILSMRPAGSLEMVRVLLDQKGIDISHQNKDGYTALMKAVEARDVDVIKILMDTYIKEEVDGSNSRQACEPCCLGSLEAVNSKGMKAKEIADKCGLGNIYNILKTHISTRLCPLGIAVVGRDIESLEILLDCHFIDQHVAGEALLEILDTCGFKELNAVTEQEIVAAKRLLEFGADLDTTGYSVSYFLSVAVKMGDYNLVKLLCQHLDRKHPLSHCDSQAMMVAAMFGRCDLISLLHEYKINIDNREDYLDSPLDCALSNGHLESAKLLIQHGAQMDIGCAVESAVTQQLPEYMNFVFENHSLDTIIDHLRWDDSIILLFMAAVEGGNMEIIGHLLDAGADVNQEMCGESPLGMCRNGDVARFLISKGANINFHPRIGYTLLLKMLMYRDFSDNSGIEVAKVLLESGAPVNERGKKGQTPLMVAASRKDNVCMLKILLEYGADINDHDNKSNTALMEAVWAGCPMNVSFLLEFHKRNNLSPNVQNYEGDTVVRFAVLYYNPTILKLLIDFPADVNIKNYIGNTPLMDAVTNRHKSQEEILTTLIHAGSDVNCQNNAGFSPLMLAARNCNKDAILVLLNSGADVNAVSEKVSTKTALSFLSDRSGINEEFKSCLRVLLTKGAFSSYSIPGLLHRMVVVGDMDVISELIRRGLGPADVKLHNVIENIVNSEVIPPVSPLCVALLVGNVSLARYFVGNLFLASSDVTSLTRNKVLRHVLEMRPCQNCLNFLNDLSSQPLSLFQLAFVAVSSAVGSSPGREDRVNMLPLPQVMKDKLLFRSF